MIQVGPHLEHDDDSPGPAATGIMMALGRGRCLGHGRGRLAAARNFKFRRPGMQLNSSCQDVGFSCHLTHFVVIDPTDLGAPTAVAQNLLQD